MTNKRPKIKREKKMFVDFGKEAIANMVLRDYPFQVFHLLIFKEFYETPRSLTYV